MKSVIFKMTENEFRRNFGDTLGRIMTEKNISQLTLANAIGVSRMTIANWLAGKNTPDLFHSYLVSKVLEIPMEALIRGEEKREDPYEAIQQRLERIEEMITKKLITEGKEHETTGD